MHVKKLSMARARQYRDISVLLLFFSINSARPAGNCQMEAVSIIQMVNWTMDPCVIMFVSAYRAKYNEWSIALLKGSKKEACPSPEMEKEMP
jgi:hypothetical protein